MIVKLIKPGKGIVVTYEAEVLERTATSLTVRAAWGGGVVNLGLLTFAPGDVLIEHFYSDRWYNVFELSGPDGRLKGWYCNVTRPALIGEAQVESEDLELDLIVSRDRAQIVLEDEDEFQARRLEVVDPDAYTEALAAVEELRGLIALGAPPFKHPLTTERR
jgi:predicted RNA-binding protein associated with RNAse of E/G family